MSTIIVPQAMRPCNGQEAAPQSLVDILITFDDLYRHGDIDAAALALGDVWQKLPPPARAQVIALVKQLTGGTAQ